jgi:uncharacterized protein YjbI with pentapeptide repeats
MPATDQTVFPHPDLTSPGSLTERDFDLVRFDGTHFGGAHLEGASFLESALVGCTLDDVHLESSRWSECTWERVVGAGILLTEATLRDVVIEGSRLSAVSAPGSTWHDVTVRGGKVDFLNLRGASLRKVRFVDCVVTELDLGEAKVDGLSFDGCTLVEPEFAKGSYAAVDLSGATLRSPRGLASLNGVTLARTQLVDLAEHLAAELGIRIAD